MQVTSSRREQSERACGDGLGSKRSCHFTERIKSVPMEQDGPQVPTNRREATIALDSVRPWLSAGKAQGRKRLVVLNLLALQ